MITCTQCGQLVKTGLTPTVVLQKSVGLVEQLRDDQPKQDYVCPRCAEREGKR